MLLRLHPFLRNRREGVTGFFKKKRCGCLVRGSFPPLWFARMRASALRSLRRDGDEEGGAVRSGGDEIQVSQFLVGIGIFPCPLIETQRAHPLAGGFVRTCPGKLGSIGGAGCPRSVPPIPDF